MLLSGHWEKWSGSLENHYWTEKMGHAYLKKSSWDLNRQREELRWKRHWKQRLRCGKDLCGSTGRSWGCAGQCFCGIAEINGEMFTKLVREQIVLVGYLISDIGSAFYLVIEINFQMIHRWWQVRNRIL